MAAKYAKIDSSLDTGFQQVPLVQNFWNFPSIDMNISNLKSVKKSKSIF